MPNQVNASLTGSPQFSSTDLAPLAPVGGAFSLGQSALAFRLRPDDRPPFRPALVAKRPMLARNTSAALAGDLASLLRGHGREALPALCPLVCHWSNSSPAG